jgi:hypothetical protein
MVCHRTLKIEKTNSNLKFRMSTTFSTFLTLFGERKESGEIDKTILWHERQIWKNAKIFLKNVTSLSS